MRVMLPPRRTLMKMPPLQVATHLSAAVEAEKIVNASRRWAVVCVPLRWWPCFFPRRADVWVEIPCLLQGAQERPAHTTHQVPRPRHKHDVARNDHQSPGGSSNTDRRCKQGRTTEAGGTGGSRVRFQVSLTHACAYTYILAPELPVSPSCLPVSPCPSRFSLCIAMSPCVRVSPWSPFLSLCPSRVSLSLLPVYLLHVGPPWKESQAGDEADKLTAD